MNIKIFIIHPIVRPTIKEARPDLTVSGNFDPVTKRNNGPFILASWWAGDTNNFHGKMDELRIYTRAITDTEARYLYNKCHEDLRVKRTF